MMPPGAHETMIVGLPSASPSRIRRRPRLARLAGWRLRRRVGGGLNCPLAAVPLFGERVVAGRTHRLASGRFGVINRSNAANSTAFDLLITANWGAGSRLPLLVRGSG